MLNKNVGYIRLSNFTTGAAQETKSALLELKKNPDCEAVVLDLRGNPGGLLIEAVDVANLFIPQGQEIILAHGLEIFFRQAGIVILLIIPVSSELVVVYGIDSIGIDHGDPYPTHAFSCRKTTAFSGHLGPAVPSVGRHQVEPVGADHGTVEHRGLYADQAVIFDRTAVNDGPVADRQGARYMVQVARAIDEAHRQYPNLEGDASLENIFFQATED